MAANKSNMRIQKTGFSNSFIGNVFDKHAMRPIRISFMCNYRNHQKSIGKCFFCTNSACKFRILMYDIFMGVTTYNLFNMLKHFLKGLHLSSISIWKYLIWLIKQSLGTKVFLLWWWGIANYCISSARSGFPYPINYEACQHWYQILLFRDRLVLAFLAQIVQESSEPSCLICKWPHNSSNMWKHLSQGVHLSPISIWKLLTWLIN